MNDPANAITADHAAHRLPLPRRPCRAIRLGRLAIGGDAPIAVQSMTNTDSGDLAATLGQVRQLADAGADLVRVSVPDDAAARTFGELCARSPVPLVADIHFDHRLALRAAAAGAACLRINPGNIGRPERVREVVECAREGRIAIRIGVNAGSLEKDLQIKYGEPGPQALVESAMRQMDVLESLDFHNYKLSLKASDIYTTVAAYRLVAPRTDKPLHLGITEAGSLRSGTVKSAAGIGLLLMEGIGDTLRVSLAADPVEEVHVAWDLLKSLRLRTRGVNLIACPSCSRQNFAVIDAVNQLEQRLADIRVPMDVVVIGCMVNGPGESKEADLGLTGASPQSLVYIDGKKSHKIDSDTANVVDELERLVRQRAAAKTAAKARLIASG